MNRKLQVLTAGTALFTALVVGNVSVLAVSSTQYGVDSVAVNAKSTNVTYVIENINQPWGLAATADGGMIIVNAAGNEVSKYMNGEILSLAGQTKSGYYDGIASAALFNNPTYTAVDSKGTVYVSDTDNNAVRKLTNGKVYTAAGNGKAGYKEGKFGETELNAPAGLAIDASNNVYVADTLNHVIRKITPEGIVSTFAGIGLETGGYQDGAASEAKFNEPMGLVFDEKGGLYVADSGNHLIRYIFEGKVTTVAGKPTAIDSLTGYMTGGYVNGKNKEARFNRPRGLTYADGVLFVADSLNNRIRAVQADGTTVNIAGQGDPGNTLGSVEKAQFNQPSAVAYVSGKLYIADTLGNSVKGINIDPKALQPVQSKEDLLAGTELLPAYEDIQVLVNGKQMEFPSAKKPFHQGGKVYLPVRSLFESIHVEVIWQAKSREVLLTSENWKQILKLNENVLIQKGTTYIESSYFEKVAGAMVVYDEESNAIVVKSGK